ncbi:MAG: hypothetical protein Ta2B_00570 [Termitinemataceae bacterium]|nr:MAG: hypothetical protein Ta2B_00570 [Termitinemataceae bacterium]
MKKAIHVLNNNFFIGMIYFLFFVFFTGKVYADNNTRLIIKNETNDWIYVEKEFTTGSNIIKEKIFFINLPIDDDPDDMLGYAPPRYHFDAIAPSTTKEFKMRYSYIDPKENDGFLIFCLYYMKRPFKYSWDTTYLNYVQEMLESGFMATGIYQNNIIYFTIRETDVKIDDEAVHDIVKFARKVEIVRLRRLYEFFEK